MSLIVSQEGAAIFDATPIENLFLVEYLPSAPEEFLRVYLYARMLCLHPELGSEPEDLCRALHLDEEALENAFRYWEQQGLVQRLQDHPPAYAILPMRAQGAGQHQEEYELQGMNIRLQELFGSNLLHPQEYLLAAEWVNDLHFTQDAVVLLVEHYARKSRAKKPDLNRLFKRIDREAARFADKGVRTREELALALAEGGVDDVAESVLKALSIRRAPTQPELAMVRKWIEEWGYRRDGILDAVSDTSKAREPSLAYLDKILDTRRQDNGEEGMIETVRELGCGTIPTPEQRRLYRAWRKEGLEPRTIVLAAISCNAKRKHTFEDLGWMLDQWKNAGIYTAQSAEEYLRQNRALREEMKRLLDLAGTERRPSLSDIRLLEEWKKQHPPELIVCAARYARGMQMPAKYMDKLLKSWREAGISDEAGAQAEQINRSRERGQGAVRENPALNYAQNRYTDSDFEDGFFVNLEDGGST